MIAIAPRHAPAQLLLAGRSGDADDALAEGMREYQERTYRAPAR